VFTWERYKAGEVAVYCEGQDEIERFLELESENAHTCRWYLDMDFEGWLAVTFRNDGYVLEEDFGWYTEDDFGKKYGVYEEVRFRDVPEFAKRSVQIDFDEGEFLGMLGV